MRLHLVDFGGHLVSAWAQQFSQCPEVTVQQGDLLAMAENCVVSLANSFGFMDGGIDAACRRRWAGAASSQRPPPLTGHPQVVT